MLAVYRATTDRKVLGSFPQGATTTLVSTFRKNFINA
jgi:hypothetical protein